MYCTDYPVSTSPSYVLIRSSSFNIEDQSARESNILSIRAKANGGHSSEYLFGKLWGKEASDVGGTTVEEATLK